MTLWIVEDEPDYLADAQEAAISAGFAKSDIFYTSSFKWPPQDFKNLARGDVQDWEKEMPQIVVMDLYDQKSGQFSFESIYHGLRYYERTGLIDNRDQGEARPEEPEAVSPHFRSIILGWSRELGAPDNIAQDMLKRRSGRFRIGLPTTTGPLSKKDEDPIPYPRFCVLPRKTKAVLTEALINSRTKIDDEE